MDIFLMRKYQEGGCNGFLQIAGNPICFTIELPWRDNRRNVSCIPEGIYPLACRYSQRWGWHLEVQDVPGRDLILFHPANDARKELRGCIAPVMHLSGAGLGGQSRLALEKLESRVFPALYEGETVRLIVSEEPLGQLPSVTAVRAELPAKGWPRAIKAP